MDRKIASVAWTKMSLVKVRSSRGENWLLANCSVTTVSENVSDVTVISELAMASSNVRAAPASPPNNRAVNQDGNPSSTTASTRGRDTPAATARTMPSTGSGRSWVRTVSRADTKTGLIRLGPGFPLELPVPRTSDQVALGRKNNRWRGHRSNDIGIPARVWYWVVLGVPRKPITWAWMRRRSPQLTRRCEPVPAWVLGAQLYTQ